MARKRTPLDTEQILSLIAAGKTAEEAVEFFAAQGIQVSRATVARRYAALRKVADPQRPELKPRVRGQRKGGPPPSGDLPAPPSDPEPLPDPDAIPEGVSLKQLEKWIRQARWGADRAQQTQDLPVLATMLRTATALDAAYRKASPPEPPNPDENPDYIELRRQAAERLHTLVDRMCKQ